LYVHHIKVNDNTILVIRHYEHFRYLLHCSTIALWPKLVRRNPRWFLLVTHISSDLRSTKYVIVFCVYL